MTMKCFAFVVEVHHLLERSQLFHQWILVHHLKRMFMIQMIRILHTIVMIRLQPINGTLHHAKRTPAHVEHQVRGQSARSAVAETMTDALRREIVETMTIQVE